MNRNEVRYHLTVLIMSLNTPFNDTLTVECYEQLLYEGRD